MDASRFQVMPSSADTHDPMAPDSPGYILPVYSTRPSLSGTGPCGAMTGTRYGEDHSSPPSVDRSIQAPRSDFRWASVVALWTDNQRSSLSADHPLTSFRFLSYATEVNVVTRIEPFGVSTTPASRSSIGVSMRTCGQLHVRPESSERISSTRPKGHMCPSRPPE